MSWNRWQKYQIYYSMSCLQPTFLWQSVFSRPHNVMASDPLPTLLSDCGHITQHHTLVIILQLNFNSKTKSYLIATSAENLRQVFVLRAWSMFYWDMEEKRVKDLQQSPAPFLLRHVTKIWKCGGSWSRPAAAAPQLRVTDCWSVTRRRGAGAGWRPSAARLPGSRAAADCDPAAPPPPRPVLTHILMWQLCCSRVSHHHQWSVHSEPAADSLWRTLPPWSSSESCHSSCILLHWILRLWPQFLLELETNFRGFWSVLIDP